MKCKVRLPEATVQGHNCGSPLVTINVRTRFGTLAPLRFIVDTGATMSCLPIPLAQAEGILFDCSLATQVTARGMVGSVPCFRGAIHLRIFGELCHRPHK
jgi:hypothetical protein